MNAAPQAPSLSPSTQNSVAPTRRQHPQPKSIFRSKTFWGIVFTTVAAVAPIIGESVDKGQLTGSDVANIVTILCGTGATLMGRIDAGNVYTPGNMPGPNKADMH